MKLTTPLLATLLALSASGRLTAAEPESSFGLAPATQQQLPPPVNSSLPLIPESPEPIEKPSTKPGATQPALPSGDKTSLAEDHLKKHIALREAKTKAERDPALIALKQQAIEAPTDFEQRKLFIDYYSGLVLGIAKYNPSMTKEDIALLKAQYTGRFIQVRLAPTIDPATFRTQR
ncbi:MAG TPA: hypothetical protein VK961_07825 [Chthoniobacter sp.]|nr:hypothetical protein [Chthoniobacter sp.]